MSTTVAEPSIDDLIDDTRRDLIALQGDTHAYYTRLRQFGAEILANPNADTKLLTAYDQFSTWKL